MRPRPLHLPRTEDPDDARHFEFGAPCTVCGGLLETVVLLFPHYRFPGETRTSCTRCKRIETPAMRLAARPTLVPDDRPTCAMPGCSNPARGKRPSGKGPGSPYCDSYCARKHWRMNKRERALAGRARGVA